MSAGEVESLGGGDAGDKAIRDLGRCGQRRRVLVTGKNQIAMDFVGNQDKVVFDADFSQLFEFIGCPDGAAWIVRAAQKDDLGLRRQLGAECIEVDRVATGVVDQTNVENTPLIGRNDPTEGVINWRKNNHLVARLADRLEDAIKMRVWVAEDSMTCVARGAERVLEDLDNYERVLVGLHRGSTHH